MSELDKLRAWFPWPSECPDMNERREGWLHPGTAAALHRQLSDKTTLVVEIGSWLGKSGGFILEKAPNATLVCIDTWLGNMHQYQDEKTRRLLPTLYDQFLRNMWDRRERVIPVRATSFVGLQILRHLGVKPDLVFVDGSHDTDDVRRDALMAAKCNSDTIIVGDDWQWEEVRKGVAQANEVLGRKLAHNDTGWILI